MPTAPDRPAGIVHVAVVDDNTFFRERLGQGAGLRPHHHVVARAENAETMAQLLRQLPDRRCDVLILDLRTSPRTYPATSPSGPMTAPSPVQGTEGIDLLLRTSREAVDAGLLVAVPVILVHTQEAAPFIHIACLAAGACGVVEKDQPLDKLGEAVDTAANDGVILTESMAALIPLLADKQAWNLTAGEGAVLTLIAHGYGRREVAGELFISENTVDKHLSSVRLKFGSGVNYTDLADSFGLRDLAVPSPTIARPTRRWLSIAASKLSRRPTVPTDES